MSLSNEEYEKEKKRRERWAISMKKKRDENTSIINGKKVINSLGKAKVVAGQQTRGKSNKAGSGLNSQEGKKKTKEDRKFENRTEEDEKNEKASWLVNFQDKNSIELVKKFKDILEDKESSKKSKKLSKKEQIILSNKKRILDKEVKEEHSIISHIEKCSTFDEVYYFYRSINHCQVLYLFTALEWCYNQYLTISKLNSRKDNLLNDIYLKIKTLNLHIEDRNENINDELLSVFEKSKLTNDMNSIECQLKVNFTKPMNDFKEYHLKADLGKLKLLKK